MNGLDFIKSKQQSWAKRKNFNLPGSTIPNKGEKNYLYSLADNLFEPLSKENLDSYNSDDGNETKDSKTRLAKMKVLHSFSAIVVNLFQYWQGKDVCPILNACKLTSRTTKVGYLIKNIGSVSPEKYELAKEISPNDTKFQYLDAAQLIKHILGLKKNSDEYNSNIVQKHHIEEGKRNLVFKRNFHLLYLWYDVIGKGGSEHRKEIEQFAEIVQKDNIKFSHITYQEVVARLSKEFYDGNEAYCDYLTDRYL